MATIYFGSARHDENGNYVNGSAGDSLQKSTPDYSGEVSMQEFYVHTKGWNILRAKSVSYADAIASKMVTACNNACIGYDQNNRYGIITYGINTTTKTECDCSSLVRECVKETTGTDPGDFTTETEKKILLATGLFDDIGTYSSGTVLYNGDILTTLSKGHTGIICSGNPRIKSCTAGWQQDNHGWWWQNSDGSYATMCWMAINNHWYLFGGSGYMLTGWVQWNSVTRQTGSGDWYYLEDTNSDGYEGACWHEKSGGSGALERWNIS